MRKYAETVQECGHVAQWSSKQRAPRIGDRIYCTRCQDMRKVTAHPGSWHAICGDTRCKFKIARAQIETVQRAVDAHLRDFPNHFVRLGNAETTVSVIVRNRSHDSGTGSATVGTTDAQLPLD